MTAETHDVAVARLREAYAALPPGTPVRLAKHTSNLFRFRDADPKSPKSPRARRARRPRRRSWTSPRSATCCASIPPAGPPGSAA